MIEEFVSGDDDTERTIEVPYKFHRELLGYLKIQERFAERRDRSFATVLYTPTGKKLLFISKHQEGKRA